jgi:hypothetical protein
VPVSTLPLVREVLRRISAAQATALATSALECATSDEVIELIRSRFSAVLGELWAEAGIDIA